MRELLGADALVDWSGLVRLLSRLAVNLAFAGAVIRLIYYRLYRNREYVFTYYLFNVITFCLCLLLRKVSSPLGLALALFGVFGILRYRTEQIRIRDLTYLFIVIGLGVLNAFGDRTVSVAELLVVNGVIVGMTAALELGSSRQNERSTPLLYDQLELLRPGNEANLLSDLSAKLGLAVVRVEVNQFDLLRDAADITVFYRH
jgi:uncharacterized protein DUF4956